MNKTIVFATSLILVLAFGFQAVNMITAQPSSVTSEHFVFDDKLYAFWGSVTLCSFEAIAGSKIVFNLSTTGDGTYGVDYEVIYHVIGDSQGSIFNYSAYGDTGLLNFSHTIHLTNDDSYSIIIAKHMFFTTVSYFGTIDVYGPEETNKAQSSTAFASFGPLGYFNVTSPYSTTYNSNILNLNVIGKVIVGSNVKLLLNYSLDGQERIPIPSQTHPAHPNDPFIGAINASVILPELSEGSHSITVFGDLEANGPHLAQAAIYFTISTQRSETLTLSPSPTTSQKINVSPSPSPSQTPQPTPEPTQTGTPTPEATDSINLLPILLAAIIVITIAVSRAPIYLKKRKLK